MRYITCFPSSYLYMAQCMNLIADNNKKKKYELKNRETTNKCRYIFLMKILQLLLVGLIMSEYFMFYK